MYTKHCFPISISEELFSRMHMKYYFTISVQINMLSNFIFCFCSKKKNQSKRMYVKYNFFVVSIK